MKNCIRCGQQCVDKGYVESVMTDHGHISNYEIEDLWVCMNEDCVYYGLVQIGKEKV